MKRLCLLVVLVLCYLTSYQQVAYTIPLSVSAANTSTVDTKNRTPFHNPACFAYDAKPLLVTSFENRYILTNLATKSLAVSYPTKHFSTGFAMYHYGFSAFHELNTGVFFARNFADKFSMGMQFNYHAVYLVQSNTYRGTVYPQIGLQIPIKNSFLIACHIFNPFVSNIHTENRTIHLPSLYSLGLAYVFSRELSWRIQMDKELRSPYCLATAFDHQFTKFTRFQVGVYHQDYLVSSIAFGLNFAPFSFDINTEIHPILGLNVITQLKYQLPYK